MEGINNATGVVAALLVVVVGLLYKSQSRISELEAKLAKAPVNQKVKKDEAKVVDVLQFPDIEDCEKKFPLCDGSHVKHNAATGDNVGPLIVNGGKAAKKE